MRDEMGILAGVENLQWLFSGTLAVMALAVPLFGWVSSRYPRRQFLIFVYCFFISTLLLFYLLMDESAPQVYLARIFFIWTSVFNLFVVSVFWSFMTDLYTDTQARRLFGFIAAGGTVGALTGPILTALLIEPLGPRNLLLVSATFLGCAVICIVRLSKYSKAVDTPQNLDNPDNSPDINNTAIGGSIWAGFTLVLRSPYLLGICLLMMFFTTLATFLYFMQAEIVRDAFDDSSQRTAVFASIDFAVNALTLLTQLFFTSRLIQHLGLAITLAIVPILLAVSFLVLGLSPVLVALIGVQIIRRAGNYAVMKPAREMLYVVLDREQKYKAKNFIDTFVYRGGDAISSWVYAGMRSLGLSLSTVAYIAVPLALIWAWIAFRLGNQHSKLANTQKTNEETS